MKKAREIIIPEDRPLTYEEFEDYKSHAMNSTLWYATQYTRSEKQLVDKLLKKGYQLEPVTYLDRKGELQAFDIIGDVMERLKEGYVLNDEAYARALISRYSDSKRGAGYIKQKLREKGIEAELAANLLEDLKDEDQVVDAIEALAQRYMNSSPYRRVEDPYKRRQKLTTHIISRGYSFDDISLWQNSKEE